jgi:hypothetical protein
MGVEGIDVFLSPEIPFIFKSNPVKAIGGIPVNPRSGKAWPGKTDKKKSKRAAPKTRGFEGNDDIGHV